MTNIPTSKLKDALLQKVQEKNDEQKNYIMDRVERPEIDYTALANKKDNDLSSALITAIQNIYAQEAQRENQGQVGNPPQIGLNQGWGGQGR